MFVTCPRNGATASTESLAYKMRDALPSLRRNPKANHQRLGPEHGRPKMW